LHVAPPGLIFSGFSNTFRIFAFKQRNFKSSRRAEARFGSVGTSPSRIQALELAASPYYEMLGKLDDLFNGELLIAVQHVELSALRSCQRT
jgi:hypothetical protein